VTSFTTEDICYRTIDGIALTASLYKPKTENPIPYVVDIHGGAWRGGDRMNNADIHRDFARHGIGVFAADFRLSEQAIFPGPVQDVNYAVRWFKANAKKLGVNASTTGGLASSSGGQLLGLVAFCPNDAFYTLPDPALDGTDASVAFLIACWPILDPLARYRMAQDEGVERLVEAHDIYFADEEAMRIGNPHYIVEAGGATHLPPMIILHGTDDGNIKHHQSDLFADIYRSAGGVIQVHKYEGQPHSFISADPTTETANAAIAQLRHFVLEQSH